MNLIDSKSHRQIFFGVWQAKDKIFNNRKDALLYASKNGCPDLRWLWHDNIWKSFNTDLLGKTSLSELYRLRAQQLRDKYDYLILSYSGGADSHNVLMSFINNNIKLDQIFVHMPFKIINSSLHDPNNTDTRARNLMSEWDYVIEPTLKQLATSHPNIKIEVSDWTDNITESLFKHDLSPETTDVWGIGNLARSINYSKTGIEKLNQGLSVATIFGADKPNVSKYKNKAYMSFTDRAILLTSYATGVGEAFYNTPDLPDLAFEMAYQVYLFYKLNPHFDSFIWSPNRVHNFDAVLAFNNAIAKKICYSDTWDFTKFQAEKPIQSGIGKDRDYFIYESPEFKQICDSWNYHFAGFLDGIDKKYIGTDNQTNKIRSPGYYLGDF